MWTRSLAGCMGMCRRVLIASCRNNCNNISPIKWTNYEKRLQGACSVHAYAWQLGTCTHSLLDEAPTQRLRVVQCTTHKLPVCSYVYVYAAYPLRVAGVRCASAAGCASNRYRVALRIALQGLRADTRVSLQGKILTKLTESNSGSRLLQRADNIIYDSCWNLQWREGYAIGTLQCMLKNSVFKYIFSEAHLQRHCKVSYQLCSVLQSIIPHDY